MARASCARREAQAAHGETMTDDVRRAIIYVAIILLVWAVAFIVADGLIRGDISSPQTWSATAGDDLHNILFGGL